VGGEIRSCRGAIGLGGREKTTNRYVKVYYEGRPNPRVQPTLRRKRLRAANAPRSASSVVLETKNRGVFRAARRES
jgi:hypothetical protein